jgi:lipid-A-disaccharide synthase
MDTAGADPRLAMVAGEASGDLLAGLLLAGLRQRWPQLTACGIGGPKMAAQGFEAWWPHHKLAVRGYVEVLKHYREIAGIRNQLAERLLRERPQLFIGVDAPDFNLGLEERLKHAGVRTVHFVCPSIWAWRGGRARRIARSADHVLCLFPFEPALLQRHGVAATFVGHPLADEIPLEVPRAGARSVLGLPADARVVALMPGSRRSELHYIAPRFFAAALEMQRRDATLRFVAPVVPGLRAAFDALHREHAPGLELTVTDGRSHDVLAACDLTLIASGTATLEAALFKRPMVIAYVMHPLTHWLMKRMAYQPWIGLPNILCEDFVVPELVQDAATPKALADAAFTWLDDAARGNALRTRFNDLHLSLRHDTARAATDALEALLAQA